MVAVFFVFSKQYNVIQSERGNPSYYFKTRLPRLVSNNINVPIHPEYP